MKSTNLEALGAGSSGPSADLSLLKELPEGNPFFPSGTARLPGEKDQNWVNVVCLGQSCTSNIK